MDIFQLPSSIPLEQCLKSFVRVSFIKPDGVTELRGMLLQIAYPWHVLLATFPYSDEQAPVHMATGGLIPFIGQDGAIEKIEQGNRLAYSNPHLPQPYPELNIHDEDDLAAINELRLKSFGPGYEYHPDHLNDLDE